MKSMCLPDRTGEDPGVTHPDPTLIAATRANWPQAMRLSTAAICADLSVRTLRRAIDEGDLRSRRIGKCVIILKPDLLAFITGGANG